MQQALADRLLPSEALEAASKLVGAFPNGGQNAGGGYIGALGAILCDYPRSVALKCCDPVKGVARETRFLPTVADIVGFCERETDAMRDQYDRERSLEADRRAVAEAVKAEQRLEDGRKARPTMADLRTKYGPGWGIGARGTARPKTMAEYRDDLIAQIGREAFDALPDTGYTTDQWKKLRAPTSEAAE